MTTAFSRQLRRMMTVRGLDIQALAELAGVHRGTVAGALNGKPVVMATATRLARALAAVQPLPLLEELTDSTPQESATGGRAEAA